MAVYRCWQGEVRSSVWPLTIKRSTAPIDRIAHDYLLRQHGAGLIHDSEFKVWRLGWAPGLEKKFPLSHYTYAMLARPASSYLEKLKAVTLQPNNPLNPWVWGAIARHALDSRSSCGGGGQWALDISIKDLDLPTGVREYLDQYAWYLEHLHCPREAREAKAKGGAEHP